MTAPLREYALYLRKSKGRAGISRQRTITTAYLQKNGGAVGAEFPDTDRTAFRKIGAGRPERPGFDQMLAWLRAHPGAGIAAWHADRLLRDPEDAELLIRAAVAGDHTVETPSGGVYDLTTATGRKRLRQDVLDAAFEVDHMTERMTAQKAEASAAGEWLGGRRPFGYAAGGMTLVPAEAALIESGSKAVIAGASLGSVARDWTAAGIPSSTGILPWSAREVGRVLRRARNAGLVEHRGKVLEGVTAAWPAVVPEHVWREVGSALRNRDGRFSQGPERRWLLSGIARCGVCGRGLIVGMATGRGRPSRPVYRCRPERSGSAKGHLARDTRWLDAYVTEAVLARLRKPDALKALQPPAPGDPAPQLHIQVAAARQQLDEAASMYAARQIDARQLAAITVTLNAEIEQANIRLGQLSAVTALDAFRGVDPEEVWDRLPLEQRRAVVRFLMSVTVHPAARGRPAGWRPGEPYFDPEYIEIGPPKR